MPDEIYTDEDLLRDARALIKFVLSEMERLASNPPAIAAEPYSFDDTRRAFMRKFWNLYKRLKNYDPRGELQ